MNEKRSVFFFFSFFLSLINPFIDRNLSIEAVEQYE